MARPLPAALSQCRQGAIDVLELLTQYLARRTPSDVSQGSQLFGTEHRHCVSQGIV